MSGLRRGLVTAVLTALAVVAGGASVQPAAWAAPEYRAHWTYDHVVAMRKVFAVDGYACGVGSLAAGVPIGFATAGAPALVGVGVGTAVSGAGLVCGHSMPDLREAVDEAFYRKCAIDAYYTEGTMSYDTTYRYVPCP